MLVSMLFRSIQRYNENIYETFGLSWKNVNDTVNSYLYLNESN